MFCTVICIFSTKSSGSVFACNVFLQNTVIYTFVTIKAFQNIIFYNVSNSLVSPNPWKHRYLHCFLQFFHVPMPLANSNIYTKNPSKTFFSGFTMFSVKNTVIFTFFGIKSVQNTGFCSVFNALASKNLSKYRYLQCFFSFVRFSIAGSLPKWPKIPPIPGLGAKSFLPPPAKADIATAILTNVIEHLVWLFAPH